MKRIVRTLAFALALSITLATHNWVGAKVMSAPLSSASSVNAPPEYTVKNRRKAEYLGVRLNEHDLYRLATLLERLARKTEKSSFRIRIRPLRVDEEITTASPSFFLGADMPKQVGEIMISALGPVYASVWFNVGIFRGAEVIVDGEDPTEVAAAFLLLQEELQRRRLSYWKFLKFLSADGPIWWFPLAFLLLFPFSAAVTVSFVRLLSLIPAAGRLRSSRYRNLGPPLLVGISVVGSFLLNALFQRAFPPVEFSGALSDSGTHLRSTLWLTFVAVLLPIAGSLAATGVIEMLRAKRVS